ncbi:MULTISPECIES: M14 family zinc carboxypeptidase [unclassified Variovorax]|uniref:M14 family zinc carboxypeptidase n=1 Tax=unclassified Variovorax TaxID=663243 RepID=UPI001BD45B3C|nr:MULTISPECIES: M14 family zinc carboxypeptidase [unclassified Variovorax]
MKVLLDIELPRTLDEWQKLLTKEPRPGMTVEGWLFEGPQVRRAAEQRLRAAGVEAHLHSAYKPLVHHFLERLAHEDLARVTVHYPVHPNAPPRRFALEAYPLVDMLGAAELQLVPKPESDALPVYEVELAWRDGRRRTDTVLAPNRVHVDHLGETLLSPTAWLRERRGGTVVADGPRESEHEAVFRHAMDCLRKHHWPEAEPYFERLDIRVDLPGIASAPARETGWIDTLEALHEDLYFSLLEVFQRRSGRPAGDRRLQPGQIVPDIRASDGAVRLRISVGPWTPPGDETPTGDNTPLARVSAPLAPDRAMSELAHIEGRRFEARSVQGRSVAGVYHPGAGPALVISGAQHANETSGVVGALRAAHELARRPDAHFALIPLENPDGYALHRELCAHAPRHMHHAARYTALGDDLEYRDEAPYFEREARHQAFALSGAQLHVNLHGYPAHEWTRPFCGYIPRGFEMWTVPKGFFLIVRHHAGWAPQARALTEHVCRQLAERRDLMAFNAAQRASYNAHAGELPFEVIHGTACMISEVNRPGPALTLITEFPDETIYGEPFILAHDTQTATVLAAVDALGALTLP